MNLIIEKEFQTLRAEAALQGIVIYRSNEKDGPVVFFAEHKGQLLRLGTESALRSFVRYSARAFR